MAKETKTCPICNRNFIRENTNRKYCSIECYKKSKKIKKIEKVCPVCKKHFKTKKKDQVYCSSKCAAKRLVTSKIELTCPICNKVFYRTEAQLRQIKGAPCCSTKCAAINMQKFKTLGCSKDRLHYIWYGMVKRCVDKNDYSYKNYGAKGVTVCKEWKEDFMVFREWALNNGYNDNLSIERLNVYGNYEPSNCTWITMKEQAKNKRNTLKVLYKGNIIRLKDIAKNENIDYKDLWQEYKQTNNIEEAIRICKLHKQGLIVTNKSGHRGVYFHLNKWQAFYKQKYIGRYNTFEEAVQARLNAEEGYKNRTV